MIRMIIIVLLLIGCEKADQIEKEDYTRFEGNYKIECIGFSLTYYDSPEEECDFCVEVRKDIAYEDDLTLTIVKDSLALLSGSTFGEKMIVLSINGEFTAEYDCNGSANAGGEIIIPDIYYNENCQNVLTGYKYQLICEPLP